MTETIKIHLLINGAKKETIEFTKDCSKTEILSAFYSAADLPDLCDGPLLLSESNEEVEAILKLRVSEGGPLIPIGPSLDANSQESPYLLEVKVGNDEVNQVELLGRAIEEICSVSPGITPDDIEELKRNVALLKKKVEDLDAPVSGSKKQPWKSVRIDPNYTTKPKYILTDETKAYLRKTSFDNWTWDDNEIIGLFEYMFEDLGVIKEFGIDPLTLKKFLMAVKDCYNNNPFHNFRHSFCVTQMMYGIIHTTGVVSKLKPIEKLILVVACIGHDLDHPGFNNAYQINAATDLAIIYNDISPLENHHAAVLFTILMDKDTNILASLPDSQYREARRNIIRCILATDMAKHGEIMAAFKKISESFNYDDGEHRILLMNMIVKCADISNEVRPTNVAEPWVEALLNEFFAQSDREKLEGLPTAPFMDREKVTKPGAQIGFIGYVMIPLFELTAKVLPNMDEPIITPIRQSLTYYKDMLEQKK